MKQGIVYLIGTGPGAPELMTLRGKSLIESADVAVFDALIPFEVLSWLPEHCKQIYVGKRAGKHAMAQEDINALLVEEGKKAQRVVRLKGGDPYVFGRGGEEAAALHAGKVPFEVIPGISSAIAAPAYAGIPVTHRKHCTQFTVFTGHEDAEKNSSTLDLEGIAHAQGTKVMLMGMKTLNETMKALIKHGQDADTPAAAVQWGTTGKQKSVTATVNTLAKSAKEAGLGAPAVIIIGDVVNEQKKLNWFETLPLHGKRIVVTRSRAQAGELSRRLRELGAEVIELPTITIAPPEDKVQFAELVVDCHKYEWIIFTSPNGVDRFFQAFFAVYQDIRSIGGARIAAVGPATAAKLKERGISVDLMPKSAVAEDLLKEFDKHAKEFGGIEHSTILWVRGAKARRTLAEGLTAMSAIVDECVAYDTLPETADTTGVQILLKQQGADVITFTSSSTVENFFALNIPLPKDCQIASIGPITSYTLDSLGHKPSIIAKKHDIEGLVHSILAYFKKNKQK